MVWGCGAGGWARMRAKCQGQACQPEGRETAWRQGDRQNDPNKSLPGKDETGSGDEASRPYFFLIPPSGQIYVQPTDPHARVKEGPPPQPGLWGSPFQKSLLLLLQG